MRRAVPLFACLAVSLVLAPESEAKVVVKEAEACGASGCRTETAEGDHDLELLRPAIESGRRTGAPTDSAHHPRYRVALTTRPRRHAISLDYFPEPGYIRVHGSRRDAAFGELLNRGWVRLHRTESLAYADLTAGLTPYGAEGSPAPRTRSEGTGGAPWSLIGIAAAVAALGAVAIWLRGARRRTHLGA
jgi:hypothetical protein